MGLNIPLRTREDQDLQQTVDITSIYPQTEVEDKQFRGEV